ncbi:SH3 domain-containing protein [Ruegeria sp. ANG-S4]|uniref:SH3 domain-containing protein n=1 Tax=Ruegeria sp. ANG-S4 TaxID=1577904 RepID=UPI000B20707D|nr:SH3 domain-containing protein [Ruegeria sp. ANG-S4]
MTRLIVITFAALGWTFYVMSGGPDFEPRGERGSQPELIASISETEPQATEADRAQDLVTNVALRAVPVRATPEPAPTPQEVVVLVEEPETNSLSGFSTFADQGANLTLASLEEGAAGLRQVETATQTDATPTSTVPEVEKDIREISGTRVNMRDGPGTIYPIIGKVTLGQKVEVLSESGTGWLRLRVLPAQQIGWVSASLVRKSSF